MEEAPAQHGRKRIHPLPGFCWMWLLAALFIATLGALILHTCFYPAPEILEKLPAGDPMWIHFRVYGIAGVFVGCAYGWFWHLFAVRAVLNRKTWHTGTGLMILGGVYLLLTGWTISGLGFLITIAVWTQGHTRHFFERT